MAFAPAPGKKAGEGGRRRAKPDAPPESRPPRASRQRRGVRQSPGAFARPTSNNPPKTDVVPLCWGKRAGVRASLKLTLHMTQPPGRVRVEMLSCIFIPQIYPPNQKPPTLPFTVFTVFHYFCKKVTLEGEKRDLRGN